MLKGDGNINATKSSIAAEACREQGFDHQTPLVGISLRLRWGGCQSGKPKRERSLG
ncbi:hypothetical protein [Coleofasciculus chthonoplastes]|nr:hypothetical protein [Coleofasciculus chthonoplastes]